jgi:hypothetical protein
MGKSQTLCFSENLGRGPSRGEEKIYSKRERAFCSHGLSGLGFPLASGPKKEEGKGLKTCFS